MPPESVIDPPSVYGSVFIAIETRLRERYHISIKDHLGEVVIPEATGKFDPSMEAPFLPWAAPARRLARAASSVESFWKARQFCKASPFRRVIFNDARTVSRRCQLTGRVRFPLSPAQARPRGR